MKKVIFLYALLLTGTALQAGDHPRVVIDNPAANVIRLAAILAMQGNGNGAAVQKRGPVKHERDEEVKEPKVTKRQGNKKGVNPLGRNKGKR